MAAVLNIGMSLLGGDTLGNFGESQNLKPVIRD